MRHENAVLNNQKSDETVYSFQVEDQVDLAAFCQLLWKHQLRHRVVSNETGRFLMVATSAHMLRVKALYQDWSLMSDADRALAIAGEKGAWTGALWEKSRIYPVTALAVFITLLISVTMLLVNPGVTGWLSIALPVETGTGLVFEPISQTFSSLQWWRLLTPVFMHFSVLHLVFNLVIVIYFMRPLEGRLGTGFALLFFLVIGVCSNLVQYYFTSSALFGGLSGIAYGLVGFVIIMQRAFPEQIEWAVNRAFLVALLGFLLLYSTGVTEIFDLHIANAAHWAGLVSGMLMAGLLVLKSKTGHSG